MLEPENSQHFNEKIAAYLDLCDAAKKLLEPNKLRRTDESIYHFPSGRAEGAIARSRSFRSELRLTPEESETIIERFDVLAAHVQTLNKPDFTVATIVARTDLIREQKEIPGGVNPEDVFAFAIALLQQGIINVTYTIGDPAILTLTVKNLHLSPNEETTVNIQYSLGPKTVVLLLESEPQNGPLIAKYDTGGEIYPISLRSDDQQKLLTPLEMKLLQAIFDYIDAAVY